MSVRYVNDGHETSPATTHDVTILPSPQGGGAPPAPSGGGTGSGPGAASPAARLVPAVLRFSGGVAALRLTVGEDVRATATLSSRGRVLARGDGSLRAGPAALRVRLTADGVRLLRRARGALKATLKLVLVDAAGNRSTLRRTVKLRR